MRTWWGRSSSSKEAKTKSPKESFIDTFHKKFKITESKSRGRSEGPRRCSSETVSGRVYQSRAESRSPSPPKNVARSQSLAEWPQAQSQPQPQPLPLPDLGPANDIRGESGATEQKNTKQGKLSKPSLFLPLPRPACTRPRLDLTDSDGELAVASVSSECSIESPPENEYDIGSRIAAGSPTRNNFTKNQLPIATQVSKESKLPRRRPLSSRVPNLQVPSRTALYSAPDNSMYSPSRSPMRPSSCEQVTNSVGKLYLAELPFPGSGPCSSPGSAQTSGHNSVGGDMFGQLFWQLSRGSPEYSPNPSPRMKSPSPGSRIHSGAVTPLHPRVGGGHLESKSNWPDDAKQRSHRLPLPPITVSNSSPFSHPNSAVASPSVPRSPGRVENLAGLGSRWKKGKLLGRGTFGHVYVGFNSETGEMCAMKEVTLYSDDAKSKESAKQLGQEIALLSRLKHPNIVQYYGTETVADRLYIYLEYVSGGSIHKILQEYGKLGESAIRSYTQQILSGLAYLHAKNTVHRDIKGANILVDPNGRVKLADFGMAKHITGHSGPLSFKGSPYWMAPEVIKNSNGCSLPVDIWSLGCTVLEMATSKPPWSQYEGIAAMFKIGNSKELPTIPDHLSDEGKEFVMLCLQRNPQNRPTAAQLLEHPFVKKASPLERKILSPSSLDNNHAVAGAVKSAGIGHARSLPPLDIETLATHSSRFSRSNIHSSDIYIPRNISCPVSPVGSPLIRPVSPQHLSGMLSPQHLSGMLSPQYPSGMMSPQYPSGMMSPQYPSGMMSPQYPSGMMSPSPISSPRAASGASTPLTGGIGTISFHNQYIPSQEGGFGNFSNQPPSPRSNITSYWDPDILRGLQSGSRAGLVDRVSQQFVTDHVKLGPPSFDLSP